jgi:hypothetical protein
VTYSPQQHTQGIGSWSEEVSDCSGDTALLVSEVAEGTFDGASRDVDEVAAVLGMVPVDVSEVANDSFDVAKVLDIEESWRVAAWVSVLAWFWYVRHGWCPMFIDGLPVGLER